VEACEPALGRIAFERAVEVGPLVPDRGDLFLADGGAGGVADAEAAFAGAVDEVGGGREVVCEGRLAGDEGLDFCARAVTIAPDHRIDSRVFAEAAQPGCEDEQLAAVGHGHPHTIDRLIAEPRAPVLFRVEPHHCFLNRLIEELNVDLCGQGGCLFETAPVGARKIAPQRKRAILGRAYHRENPYDRWKLPRGHAQRLVEQRPNRRVRPPHNPFHAAHRAKIMTAVDRLLTASADEDILRVVGHPRNLMGHYLPY